MPHSNHIPRGLQPLLLFMTSHYRLVHSQSQCKYLYPRGFHLSLFISQYYPINSSSSFTSLSPEINQVLSVYCAAKIYTTSLRGNVPLLLKHIWDIIQMKILLMA